MKMAAALALVVALGGCSRSAPAPTVGPGNVCGDPALFGETIAQSTARVPAALKTQCA